MTDESLAKALGWTQCEEKDFGCDHHLPSERIHAISTAENHRHFDCWSGWRTPTGSHAALHNWSTSFDACLRDIVPVLRARGVSLSIDDYHEFYRVRMSRWRSDHVSLLAAFCEAALAALEATNG